MNKKRLEFIYQKDQIDCGPACLYMITSVYGKTFPLQYLREKSFITRDGVSLLGISEAAEEIGFETLSGLLTIEKLREMPMPSILYWNQRHFVVLLKIYNSKRFIPFSKPSWRFVIADPGHGLITLQQDKFENSWISEEDKGIGLFLEPTENFYRSTAPTEPKISFRYILSYLKPFKKQLFMLFFMLLLGSGITLIFPFLTQNLIDKGVNTKDITAIKLILLAQLGLFLGSISAEIVRNWITLHVGSKISIQIISDFIKKLMQLPISFFDTKMMGDFNQRIQDNEYIEHFLTSQSLLTFFSMISFSVFFGILFYYDAIILLVYLILTVLAVLWSLFWLKKVKKTELFSFSATQRKSRINL